MYSMDQRQRKEQNPRNTSLNLQLSRLLFTIWKLEDRHTDITNKFLAETLHIPEATLRGQIKKLLAISRDYLEIFSSSNNGTNYKNSGRKKNQYRLNGRYVVTYPETACLLLELKEFQRVGHDRVNVETFTNDLIKKFDIASDLVKNRINVAMEAGYIRREGVDSICHDVRVERELAYLKLLANIHYEKIGKIGG
jgi:hypothetical protein